MMVHQFLNNNTQPQHENLKMNSIEKQNIYKTFSNVLLEFFQYATDREHFFIENDGTLLFIYKQIRINPYNH